MLGHYALTLYRSLTRHRLYAAINVLGLAVGVAVFLVLALDVRFEAVAVSGHQGQGGGYFHL